MHRFHKIWFATLAIFVAHSACAQAIFPSGIGTTWTYQAADYPSTGTSPSVVTETLVGTEKIDGHDALKLERRADSQLQRTEFIIVDDRGVFSVRRSIADGKTTNFNPPQEMFPAALKFGAKWERDDEIAGSEIHEQFVVKVEEDLAVPAGKFHTFLCESAQPWPISMTIQRWISPGVGLVKEVTTTRGPTGRLMSRNTVVLQKFSPAAPSPNEKSTSTPTAAPTPSPTATPSEPPHFTLLIAAERDGPLVTALSSKTENIFVRWIGENLPVGAQVRVAWIAEDVGDVAPPNFVVDQSDTTVDKPQSGAQFTLSRPKDGWAAGKYRVDLSLDGQVVDTANVKITD